jgi:hypothetical protein
MADAFQPKFVDLVRNISTTTGTGNFILGPAVAGYNSFTSACAIGDGFYYSAIGLDRPSEREVGRGTLLAGGAISRDPIGGVRTNFSNGTKSIALIAAAEWFTQVQAGAGAAATRSALAAIGPKTQAVFLSEAGREGLFRFDPSNLAAKVAADSAQGFYVAPQIDPTGSSGAWVRQFSGAVSAGWFGISTANPGAANSSAIAALFAALKARVSRPADFSFYDGLEPVIFAPGEFNFAATIELSDGTFTIEGAGIADGAGTTFKFAAGVTGVRVQRFNTSGVSATRATAVGADRSIIRNLRLRGGYAGSEAECHGIHLRASAILDNVIVTSFEGDGVYINAVAGSATAEGNANLFSFRKVRCVQNRNGFFIDGDNDNAGILHGCDASANRQWGFWDSSFLGNTYVGCHSDSNGLTAGTIPSVVTQGGNRYCVKAGQEVGASSNAPTGTASDNGWWYFMGPGGADLANNIVAWSSGMTLRTGGSYRTDDPNAQTVLVGCYHESGQGFAQLTAPTLVLGGMMSPCVRGVSVLCGGTNISSTGGITAAGSLVGLGNSHNLGPQAGVATDTTFYLDHTNSYAGFQSRYWNGGPTNVASVLYVYGFGTIHDVQNAGWAHRFRVNGAGIVNMDSAGVDIQAGKVLKVNGTQVVAAQQTAIPNDASGAPNQGTVNAILSALRAHGLIAS